LWGKRFVRILNERLQVWSAKKLASEKGEKILQAAYLNEKREHLKIRKPVLLSG